MIIADEIPLPELDEPAPNLALMLVGKALAETYRDAVDEQLPECLMRIVRALAEREAADRERR